jgi:diguanylate cyclase (GGDEF)-like protein
VRAAGIRFKLSAAFTAVSLGIAGFVIGTINMQLDTIERATMMETEHFVGVIAYAGADNALSTPEYLQRYADALHVRHSRDLVFVDSYKKGIADTNREEVGMVFDDPGGEVTQTLRDGRTRSFVERNTMHPQGVRQIVVALHATQMNAFSPMAGAAIVEYGHIYDGLLAAEEAHLYLLGAAGCACVLLSVLFGLRIAEQIARRLKGLQDAVDFVAEGHYDAKVAVVPRDEIGRLGTAFNTMAGALKGSRDELVEYGRGLEDRVASRTRDLTRMNRVYAVLSGTNALIVRVRDRDELFREACRIAVEEGRFAKAWIGLVDADSKEFRMTASRGGDPRFFPQLETLLKEKIPQGRGAAARAIATLQPVVSNDMASDREITLKEDAIKSGAQSLVMMPLVVAGEAVGVLSLYAEVTGFFDAEEVTLLTELAGNIAFAIDHIEKRERIEYLASYDELTGLANRRLYLERLERYLGAAGHEKVKLAVLVFDIERFRSINESAGRQAGDDLLRQLTARLQSHMKDPKWLARIGSDQFASIVPDAASAEAAARIEQRMREVFTAPFMLGELEVRISAKIGIALYPDHGSDAETLLRNAEAALKKAKAIGERYLFYTTDMNARVAANLTLENRLREALEKEEFVLHYQPKINLQSGKLTSAEALIRWNDPRTGLVPPGHFIPILEETGLILDVGRWALRKALEDYLRWRAAGLPAVRIAVNVSPLQLRNRDFIAEIGKAAGVHADAAAGLELEITESVIMHDVQHNIATLKAIRAMGVTVAIDDFGTGFSSLAYLAKLPVDTLKIDRSFVVDMMTGPDGLSLVSTIINLARALKLKVVAEGVETQEQSNLLRLLSCDEMQGFLFSRPVPAADFEAKFLALPRTDAQAET